jgi:predicted phosphodiesterase
VRYLIISDIHGNLHALTAVMEDALRAGYDDVLCLGDLVGYGADPAAVLARTFEMAPKGLIRGNHDKVCAGIEPPTFFNEVARRSVRWTQETLSDEEMRTLAALPQGPVSVTDDIEICHGAPFDEDHYIFDEVDAARAIASTSARICLFGHTHLPAFYVSTGGPVRGGQRPGETEVPLPREGTALINVGSVGQPRDGDPRAAYGILDTERDTIQLYRVDYDLEGAQQRILKAGLPAFLATRLGRGQ